MKILNLMYLILGMFLGMLIANYHIFDQHPILLWLFVIIIFILIFMIIFMVIVPLSIFGLVMHFMRGGRGGMKSYVFNEMNKRRKNTHYDYDIKNKNDDQGS